LLAAIDWALGQGGTVVQSCQVLGLERSRYYRWTAGRALAEIAMADLAPGRPGPRPGAGGHRLLEAEKEAIKAAARADQYKDLRYRKLCHQISRDAVVQVGESSVYRVLQREGLIAPVVAVVRKKLRPETEASRANQLWGWDVSYLKVQDIFMYLISIIDFYSRKIVGHELSFTQMAEDMKRVWDRALSAEGLLDRLGRPINLTARNDNGSPMKAKSMRQFFRDLGIVQEFTRGATPTDNAITERCFKTVKYEKLYLEDLENPLVAMQLTDDFIRYYNEERLHQGIGFVTPLEKHTGKDVEILTRRKEALAKARQNRLDSNRHPVELNQVQAQG
jgi:putative transposase